MMSNDLCEELIVDIFSRLPTKSLLRFRSVSKSVYACIGSPEFIRLHTPRSPERIMLIHDIQERKKNWRNAYTLHSEDQFPYNINIDITPVTYHFGNLSIPGSCNGIICHYESRKSINLWNPSIRRKVNVHYHPSWGDNCPIFEFGFSFDPIMDDYKILRITTPTSFIYTLKTHTWREIAAPSNSFFRVKSFQCLFNGALHCAVMGNLSDTRDVRDYYYYMIKFELSSEVFSMIELPEPSWITSAVTIIKGSLAVFSVEPNLTTWIWVMREYNDPASWSLAFKLDETRLDMVVRAFHLTANDNILLHYFFGDFMVYNPVTHASSRLVEFGDSSRLVSMTKCSESLGLLDMGTSC